MKKLLISTTLAATLFTPQAFAQNADMGSYLGLGFGQSNIKLNSTDFSDLDTKDETGSAFKIYGGQQFNKNLAVEIGYANLGKATGTGTASRGFATATASNSYKASALTVAAVGLLPLENSGFSLLGMAGLSVNRIETKVVVDYVFDSISDSVTKSKTDFYYGVGAKYAINKNFAVRVQYENFGKAGDEEQGTRSKLDLTSLNVEYKF
jgi:OmpA-OmpF porin, OOP family